jgi:hypothetical protein
MTGLFGSTILEVAIGIIFIYLLLALCCTSANEWISGLLKMRSKVLFRGIEQLLGQGDNPSAAKIIATFYGHPLIRSVMPGGDYPSYLSARAFATTIMDIATPKCTGAITFDDLIAGIENDLPDSGLRTSLLALLQSTDKSIEGAQWKIEAWYDDAMDRVSGWYKRKTQVWTLVIASVLTIATNADTLNIARRLWVEPTLRSAASMSAQNQGSFNGPIDAETIDTNTSRLLGQVIGWQDLNRRDDPLSWAERISGWILTVIAVSLGSPFWFDVLKRFANLRSAGRSPIEFGPPPRKPSAPIVTP